MLAGCLPAQMPGLFYPQHSALTLPDNSAFTEIQFLEPLVLMAKPIRGAAPIPKIRLGKLSGWPGSRSCRQRLKRPLRSGAN